LDDDDDQGSVLNYNRTIGELPEGRPIDALLGAYAAKTLAEPLSALAAAHLELKPDNRAYVAALEAVHGVLLEELKPVPLAGRDRRLVNIFAAPAPDPAPTTARPRGEAALLPRALRSLAGCDLADLPWRNRGSGCKEVVLSEAGAPARFICVRPGARLPVACEAGTVTALVLAGAAGTGSTQYGRGDIIFTGVDMPNAPTVVGEQDCVCFVVAESAAKPAGPLSRMLHLVTGG
jgi:predicted ChrR family anti-sigma factor